MPENFENRDENQQEGTAEQHSEIKMESQIDQELSHEVIEKVMAKVKDINEKGTAIHGLKNIYDKSGNIKISMDEVLPRILKEGLLGHELWKSYLHGEKLTKEQWAERAKKRKRLEIFFNVVGGDIDKIKNAPWMDCPNTLGIIFTTKFLKKYDGGEYHTDEQIKARTFGPTVGLPNPPPAEGYVATFRVAPRSFDGIVFNVSQQEKKIEEETGEEQTMKLQRGEELSRTVQENIEENYWVPIYDVDGNLWWPKQMSYEDVKEFVAEREKQKEEEK